MSRTWFLAALLAAVLLAPGVSAGSASDPELTDPAGDADTTISCAPPCVQGVTYNPDAGAVDRVDITAVWVEEFGPRYAVIVQTAGTGDDATEINVEFTVEAGPTSVFDSTANGTTVAASATGTTLGAAPANTTLVRDGDLLRFNFTRADTGVSGGDLLTNLVADASHTSSGGAGVPGSQTVTDGAPNADQNASRPYAFVRPDIVAGAVLAVVGAVVVEDVPRELDAGEAALSGPEAADDTVERTRNVTDDTVETYDAAATTTFTLLLENTGTDVDTYRLDLVDPLVDEVGDTVVDDAQQDQALDVANVTLDPGATANVTLTITLRDAEAGKYATVVEVVSDRNATASAGVVVERLELPFAPEEEEEPEPTPEPEPEPEEEEEREPVAGLDFLTPAAEAMGFDEAFGDWAELVLLALILLLVLVVVFLLLALLGSRWVAVRVTPKTLTARPGETAEFQVEVRNRRKRFRGALASFERDPGVKAGVLLRGEDGSALDPLMDAGEERELALAGKDQRGGTLEGTLRVQLPDDMAEGERGEVTLNVVPIADDGRSKPRKGSRARVRVVTAGDGSAKPARGGVPVRLSEVRHEPQNPQANDVVTTTATLANDSDAETLRFRVVLQLDGEEADEETVEVPPRSARAVVFRWLADEGSNRVRVQVYPAE